MSGSTALTGQETIGVTTTGGGALTVTLNQIAALVALQVAINLEAIVNETSAQISANSGSGIDLSAATVTPGNVGTKASLASLIASLVPLEGATMSGVLKLSQLPIAPEDAANKGYIDNAVATAIAAPSGTSFVASLQQAMAAGLIRSNGGVLEFGGSV